MHRVPNIAHVEGSQTEIGMKNLLNPIRNTLHRLVTVGSTVRMAVSLAALTLATTSARSQVILGGDFESHKPGSTTIVARLTGVGVYESWLGSIPNPAAPISLTVSGGRANYRDSTIGSTEDLTGWTKIQWGADVLANGPGSLMSLNVTDFANTGATAITVNRVTPTVNPAVFLVGVAPAEAGVLRLQVMAGGSLTVNRSSACS
jgi:hypothetical protein